MAGAGGNVRARPLWPSFDRQADRTYRVRMAEKSTEKATVRESLIFFAKLAAYLVGLAAFGAVIFALTRSLVIHR